MPTDKDIKKLKIASETQEEADLTLMEEIEKVDEKCESYHKEMMGEMKEMKGEMMKTPPMEAMVERVASRVSAKVAIQAEEVKPKEEELVALIKPLIPEPINGKDGRDGKDGKDGLNGLDGRNGVDGKNGENGKDGSPDTGEQIIEKINSDESEKLIKAEKVEGLDDRFKEINGKISNVPKGGGLTQLALQMALSKLFFNQTVSTSSATTTLTLTHKVAGNICIWLRYQGQMLHYGTHYTISGTTVTFLFTLADSTTVEISAIRG